MTHITTNTWYKVLNLFEQKIKEKIYLPVCCLFDDAVSSSDCTASYRVKKRN
jgi:hypothetical protein